MVPPALTYFFVILFTPAALAALQSQPQIFTNGSSLHISSGVNGDIVFEPSQQGKILFGGHELNVTGSVGPPGVKGERGAKGINGTNGTVGDTGEKGDSGKNGGNGTNGRTGEKGKTGLEGQKGDIGPSGPKGTRGTVGARGNPGPSGTNIDIGPYYTDLDRHSEKCNASSVGTLRYSSQEGLQLCTTVGWRNMALQNSPPPCSDLNIPKKNMESFLKGNPGIMFQFNGNITPSINPTNYNSRIKAELLFSKNNSVTTQASYVDAVMRQAVHFSGEHFINVSGIPEEFWQDQNWTVAALLKFGKISVKTRVHNDIPILGIGNSDTSHGLHLGIIKKNYVDYQAILEQNTNNLNLGNLLADTWYHLTWTSMKTSANKEQRCIIIDGRQHKCETTEQYNGSALTTIGSWGHEDRVNNLVLDHLVISSGVINYVQISKNEKQLCFAKLVDRNLP